MKHALQDRTAVSEPKELLARVSYRVRLLQIAAYKSFEKVVTGHGNAPRYFGMLKIIQANPGIPQTRLAETIFLDRSTLVPILETLSAEGWIERKATSQDRRVRRVFLTDQGKQKLVDLEVKVDMHEAIMTAGLSDAEKTQLLGLLDKLDANLRAALNPKQAGGKE